jgi:6-phosphogluconate dehydrogenase
MKENPNQDGIEGFVAESGEARWALEVAKEFDIETQAIQASFDVRLESQKGKINFATKVLASMRNAFGGHTINESK